MGGGSEDGREEGKGGREGGTAAAVDGGKSAEEDHRRAVLRLDLQNKRPGSPDHADQWRSTADPDKGHEIIGSRPRRVVRSRERSAS